jgi:hypothetical protein
VRRVTLKLPKVITSEEEHNARSCDSADLIHRCPSVKTPAALQNRSLGLRHFRGVTACFVCRCTHTHTIIIMASVNADAAAAVGRLCVAPVALDSKPTDSGKRGADLSDEEEVLARKKSKTTDAARRFHCTPATLLETLREYGVAVLPNVLNEGEIAAMRTGAWSTLEHLCQHASVPLKQANPATWKSFDEIIPNHSMLLQHYGVGHAQFIWDLRQNPKVVAPFAEMWKCKPNDLLVSFDAMSFHLPPETTGFGHFKSSWWHTDQSPLRNDFECIQSWVTAYDVNEGDATLAVLVGSHKHHNTLRAAAEAACAGDKTKKAKSDWFRINEAQLRAFKNLGCEEAYITCGAGSMVFWDSRTLHFGRESLATRAKPNFRCIAYVCMLPRRTVAPARNAKEDVFKRKQEAFKKRNMTSHWANKCILFSKAPWTWGKRVPPRIDPIPEPVLTPLGRKLAGF